jgi:pimeloyl-ACP methyl ester carboxylesterase
MSTPYRGAAVEPVAHWLRYTESAEGMIQWNDEMMVGRFKPDAVSDRALQWFRRTQERTSASVLRHFAHLVAGADLTQRLAALQIPTLLIVGDSSPYVGLGQLAALHKLLPHTRVQVIPHAAHGIAFSHAQTCSSSFLEFVATTDKSSSFLP